MYKLYRKSDNLYLVAISKYTADVLIKSYCYRLVDEIPKGAKQLGLRRKHGQHNKNL